MLVANNNYDKNWKLLKLYNSLLQAANCCFKNQEFDNQSLVKYVYFFHAYVLYNELLQQPDTPENQALINQIKAAKKFELTHVRDLALMYKLLTIAPIQICGKPRP